MTELSFLSVEVENDSDNVDDSENIAYKSCDKPQTNVAKPEIKTDASRDEEISRTVEICQKTVNPDNRVKSENFNILRVIGKGAYGKVFLVQKVDGVDNGKYYAMKVLKKARLICSEKDQAHTASERNILEMLRHPFLVRLHYAFQNHSNLYIVLEYCPGGELFNHLEREGSLLENAACFYTAEIVLAIGHLHSLGIIYRDLKSENVLLDRQGHVKLTDFGLSKEGVCTTNTFCGTIEYMAPEIIRCEGHGKPVDWWSLGTLLFDMLSGGPPFSQQKGSEATTREILTAPLRIPVSFSPEASHLIRGLLKRDPRERLGTRGDVEEVKRHKFFRRYEINWSDVFHRRLRPPFKPKLSSECDVSMFDPHFTHLQPVVSPADSSRPIPSDMFQGFSYVAPSVCEKETGDAWLESPLAGTQRRRHFGSRSAASAGRLQRLGVAPTKYGVNTPLLTATTDAEQSIQEFKSEAPGQHLAVASNIVSPDISAVSCTDSLNPSEEHKNTRSVIDSPMTSTDNLLNHKPRNQVVYKEENAIFSRSSQVNSCFKKPTIDEDDGNGGNACDNEEDEEIEDEDIPGAKQICSFASQPSYTHITQPLACSTFSSHSDAQKEDRRSALLPSKSIPHSVSYTSPKNAKSHLTASPLSYTSIGMAASSQRNPTNNGLPSVLSNNPRRGTITPLTSSPAVSPPTTNTSSATSSSSGSKCVIM